LPTNLIAPSITDMATFFVWFDCLHVGLTATPVDKIHRNTYRLFGCQIQHPTAYYSLEKAIEEKYLVPYEVYTHTTEFLRDGIKYAQLTDAQKEELEDADEDPTLFQYDAQELDKKYSIVIPTGQLSAT